MKYLVASGMEMLAEIATCDLNKLSLKYFWMEDDLPVSPLSESSLLSNSRATDLLLTQHTAQFYDT